VAKTAGRGRKTGYDCVKVEMKRLGLVSDDAHNLDKWRSLTTGNCPALPHCGSKGVNV